MKKFPFVRGGQIKYNNAQQNGKPKSCVQERFFLSLPLPLSHQRFVKKKHLLRCGTPKLLTLGLCLSCSDIEWSRLISISKRLRENLNPRVGRVLAEAQACKRAVMGSDKERSCDIDRVNTYHERPSQGKRKEGGSGEKRYMVVGY